MWQKFSIKIITTNIQKPTKISHFVKIKDYFFILSAENNIFKFNLCRNQENISSIIKDPQLLILVSWKEKVEILTDFWKNFFFVKIEKLYLQMRLNVK